MNVLDNNILSIDANISRFIMAMEDREPEFLSQNILCEVRDLVEAVILKMYYEATHEELIQECDFIKAERYIASNHELTFLSRFYSCLKVPIAYYTLEDDASVRLMLKYYDYLLKLRELLLEKFGLSILGNLEDYPIDSSSELTEYYEAIARKVDEMPRMKYTPQGWFYVRKERPIFVNGKTYYELTLVPAYGFDGKANRFTVFSGFNVSSYYAIKISVIDTEVVVLDQKMPIKILDSYQVAIKSKELNRLAAILGYREKISTKSREYDEMMEYLTKTGKNLVEIIDFGQFAYENLKSDMYGCANTHRIFDLLDICRELSQRQSRGANIIRYLLYRMRGNELADQYKSEKNEKLSDLYLDNKCIPFDTMPLVFSLIKHNPRLSDVIACVGVKGREHELLARVVRINAEQRGKLYTKLEELECFDDVRGLVAKYNDLLYKKHKNTSSIAIDGDKVYINEYEMHTVEILRRLKEFTDSGVPDYENGISSWIAESPNAIDSEEKLEIVKRAFVDSKLAVIYGSAGTGKTTLIKHISDAFEGAKKLFLANTHTAVENLRRRIKTENATFRTISKEKIQKADDEVYDIVFIDECSTVSNSDMCKMLRKITCEVIVLAGDVYQIESIEFGNWFSLAGYFIPQSSVHELQMTRRTDSVDLLELWSKVRNVDPHISEFMASKGYSSQLNENIFSHDEDDQIMLCLNYDGLYGINNINRFLQYANPHPPVEWGVWTYKVNDPIIFNENNKFHPELYNNLKGWIRRIEKCDSCIVFDVEIEMVIDSETEEVLKEKGADILVCESKGRSRIRFQINKYVENDEDEQSKDEVVPFQVAYAVSIHKAQGLEYDSVKVVVTKEIEELITHNIFYTAITRARSSLKVYWKPEAGEYIIKRLIHNSSKEDAARIASKYVELPLISF